MRTRESIDQEYAQIAIMLGHKTRIMQQAWNEAEKLKADIAELTKKLLDLNAEGLSLKEAPASLKAVEPVAVLPGEPSA